MNNKDNYRLLGIGETVSHGDCYEVDGELIPVESYALGQIIDGDEFIAILRPSGGDLISRICREYDIQTETGVTALRLALENASLLDRKHRDYGAGNISAFGEYGIMVRLSDKMERLKKLLTNGGSPNNESIEDTYRDVSCYSIIALMVRRNLWK
jgi:hypothetical protein